MDVELRTVRPEVKATIEHWRGGKLIDKWEHGGDMVTNKGRAWLCNKVAGSAPDEILRH